MKDSGEKKKATTRAEVEFFFPPLRPTPNSPLEITSLFSLFASKRCVFYYSE